MQLQLLLSEKELSMLKRSKYMYVVYASDIKGVVQVIGSNRKDENAAHFRMNISDLVRALLELSHKLVTV